MQEPFYKLRVKGTTFELPRKYTSIRWLGGGSYGHVVAAECAGGGPVAIKRVGGVFRNRVDAKRILREMRILRHLRSHANEIGRASCRERV